jgi:uncharacterized oxidoreductase
MQLSSNTFLVTGGASGIGLALAERFVAAGSNVIICGRRAEKLAEAKERLPHVKTLVCDLSKASERSSLAAWVVREHPRLNVLVNNAGIQRYPQLAQVTDAGWPETQEEIAINFEAPVHLSALFIPHLRQQARPAIVNVTSGLSFTPLARAPIYCATKAAMHSFTLSLRHQLKDTPIRVVELIPPAVDTDLGGPGLHTFGVKIEEFMNAAMPRLEAGDLEVTYGFAAQASRGSRAELDAMFERMNQAR